MTTAIRWMNGPFAWITGNAVAFESQLEMAFGGFKWYRQVQFQGQKGPCRGYRKPFRERIKCREDKAGRASMLTGKRGPTLPIPGRHACGPGLHHMRLNPTRLKWVLNLYPPYWGTGISVRHISRDYRKAVVRMKMRWYNRNYVRTHFGGSLYAMTDPFFMLMLIHILGDDYVVWDKAAKIDFVKPGRGTLTATFLISDEAVADIVSRTAVGRKYLPEFSVDIVNTAGEVVARITKILYVRKKEAP